MKACTPIVLAAAVSSFAAPLFAQSPAPSPAAPNTDIEKRSYAIGTDVVTALKKQGIDIDPVFVAAGIRDAGTGATMQMKPEEIATALNAMRQDMMAKRQAMMAKQQEEKKAAGATNASEGLKFLAENKGKPGVTTLPDGLQYIVQTAGTGETPKTTDTVTVNYRGTLINGKEFDSSYKRGEPATFPVTGVIKGWTEILQLMKVGSKYQVFIPAELAYGERGAGADIGPNATLIFEIELLSIKAPDAQTPPPAASAATSPAR